jgi:hypothetical protein
MKDARRAPFCYQTLAALATIRERFPVGPESATNRERTVAQAIYLTLTFVANEQRRRDGFEASRRTIGLLAGTSDRTVDRYVGIFEELELVEVERRRVGGLHLSNRWTLIEPAGGEAASPPAKEDRQGSRESFARSGEADSTRLQEDDEEEAEEASAPRALGDGALSPVADEVVNAVLGILQNSSRLVIESRTRGQVAHAIASRPEGDPRSAAHEAVARADDPSWRTTDAGRTFLQALQWQGSPSKGGPGRESNADRVDADVAGMLAEARSGRS